jgi:c-di-GMP-binding flagellar brake protein YcgR
VLSDLKIFSFFDKWKKKSKPIQRNILVTDEEISRLLNRLQKHLIIITAKFPSDPETYNTSIIKIDYKNKWFYLDELVPSSGNEQIISQKKVLLRTRLDGSILTMECKLDSVGEENGLPHYRMHFPIRIKSIQRRESYRVSIPLNKRFQVNMQTDSGHFIAGFLNDISFSGIAIRLENSRDLEYDLNVNDIIPFLTLHLDETITCELEIKRISKIFGNVVVSGHLEEISPEHQKIIQKFIIKQDREKRKQENS